MRRPTTVALVFLALSVSAQAQTQSATADPSAPVPQPQTEKAPAGETTDAAGKPRDRKRAEEEITVTGSRIRRKDLLTPAPITVISREQVTASGKVTLGDFLQTLPEQGNAINTQVNNGGSGATRVALRGLGPARTLVLVNGRRFVPGGTGADTSVDLNSIPANAVERIEVLKDGASAVYGSDAIGGVVNIITRKRAATELNAYTGISNHGDGQIYDINGTTGATGGENGNFIFSGGFYRQEPVWAADRAFSAIPLAYDATGTRTLNHQPGPYSQGSTTVPAGTIVLSRCGKSTPASTPCIGRLLANPNNDSRIALLNSLMQQNPGVSTFIRDSSVPLGWRAFTNASLPQDGGDGYNFQPQNYLVTPSQRISLYSAGDARFSELARAYFEASYVNRQSKQLLAAEPLLTDGENVVVSKDNIYNPFGVDLQAVRRRLVEFTNRTFQQDIDTFRVVGGVDGTLPEQAGPVAGWFWDTSLNFGRTEGTQIKQGNLNKVFLQSAVGPSFVDASGVARCGTPTNVVAGCVPLNLFGGAGSITPDQVTPLTFTGALRGTNQMTSFLANTGGELFHLFAERPVGLAAGYEYRFLSGESIPDPLTVAGLTTGNKGSITRGKYHVNEGYGELSVPILSNVDYAQDLEATIAGRVFNYSTFGTGGTYKFGTRWRVVRDFTVRGTYSTGFRAPSISDLYAGLADAFPPVSDPCRGAGVAGGGPPPGSCGPAANNGDAQTQLRSQVGGNPLLKPEHAKMFTTGIVIEPRMVRNLAITVDYYNITVDDTITTLGASVILSGCYPSDPSATPKYCNLITRDPVTQRITNIVNQAVNVGQDKTDGIDLALTYAVPTASFGRFTLGFDGTWLHKYDRTLADGTLIHGRGNFDLNGSGTGGVYPAFKFVSGVSWSFAGLAAGVNTRFLSAFTECGTSSGNFAGSGLCYVNATYTRRVSAYNTYDIFLAYTISSTLGRTTIGAGVNNLFDKAPSAIYNGFTAASDPTAYDFMGRFFYGRIGHAF